MPPQRRLTRRLMTFTCALLLPLCLAGAASARKPTIGLPDPTQVTAPGVVIHDSVPKGHASRRVRRATHDDKSSGGWYGVGGGQYVHVLESDAYAPDDGFNQAWANFFAGLVHYGELSRVTVYFAPYEEMTAYCGSDSDACYFPSNQTIVLSGDPLPDGDAPEAVAAHEYGHHVARNRLNDVGSSEDWGPEYWATYEQVCYREQHGQAFPGDEDANYDRNPGEAWAETYRVLNGRNPGSWQIIAPQFKPDLQALALAKRDVVNPFAGDEYIVRGGRFGRRGSRWREFNVPVENDGPVDVRLTGTGSLDADIYIYTPDGVTRLDHANGTGHREHYRRTYCGYRNLQIAIYRYSGTGNFTFRATLPFFT
jgi:hypothetical protein